jgi:hypothetical protein
MPFRKTKINDAAERLAKIELFDGFSAEELNRVADLVSEVDAEAGAVLVEQGKPGDGGLHRRRGPGRLRGGGRAQGDDRAR